MKSEQSKQAQTKKVDVNIQEQDALYNLIGETFYRRYCQ